MVLCLSKIHIRDQVNIIERQLASLRGPRGMFMVQQDRAETTYELKRVPNLSFKNKYNKLLDLMLKQVATNYKFG